MSALVAWLRGGIRLPLLLGAAALLAYGMTGSSYQLRLLTLSGIYALLVLGYQFIFGHAGALALTQGAFFGLGAYATGILGSQFNWTFVATFPLSIALPVALAALVALPVLRLESHYFALATLGVGQVLLLVAIQWESLTGGPNGLSGVPSVVLFDTVVQRGPMTVLVWLIVGAGAVLAWSITRGRTGRALALMRDDALAAQAIGIDVGRLRFAMLLLSAGYGGAAGALYAHTLHVISTEVLEFSVMVVCLTMTVVGGRTRIAGAIVGAVLLVHLPEWLRGLDRYYLIAYGALLLAAIVIAPEGIVGTLARWRAHLWPEPMPVPPAAKPLPTPDPSDARLAVHGISKRFGGVQALDDVSLTIDPGTIVGLIGPNGSGKTTLVNVVTGLTPSDAGSVHLPDADLTDRPAHAIARAGIARTFQAAHLIDAMPALDAVAVAVRGAPWSTARARAMTLLDALGLAGVAMRPCGALAHGLKRRVEIARALALQPRLLLLDEPAAGLNPVEQQDLAARLGALARDGLGVLVIEHNMAFLMPLVSRVVCLDQGRVIADGTPDEIRANPRVIAAYLGTPT
jgi:branched-chain amino acid transport system permease protein